LREDKYIFLCSSSPGAERDSTGKISKSRREKKLVCSPLWVN